MTILKKFFAIAVLFALTALSAMAQSQPEPLQSDPQAEVLRKQGGDLIGKDNTKALELLNQALKIDPNDAKVYHNRGVAYYAKKDYDRAIADYTQYLKIEPNDEDAINNLNRANKMLAEKSGRQKMQVQLDKQFKKVNKDRYRSLNQNEAMLFFAGANAFEVGKRYVMRGTTAIDSNTKLGTAFIAAGVIGIVDTNLRLNVGVLQIHYVTVYFLVNKLDGIETFCTVEYVELE